MTMHSAMEKEYRRYLRITYSLIGTLLASSWRIWPNSVIFQSHTATALPQLSHLEVLWIANPVISRLVAIVCLFVCFCLGESGVEEVSDRYHTVLGRTPLPSAA